MLSKAQLEKEILGIHMELDRYRKISMKYLSAYEDYNIMIKIGSLSEKLKDFNQKLNKLNKLELKNAKLSAFSTSK